MKSQIIRLQDGSIKHATFTHYPDQQKNLTLDMEYYDVKTPVNIQCNIRLFDELQDLLMLVGALRHNDFYIEGIDFKYLMGMRSDRAFGYGMPNYFKQVIAPIINNLEIPLVQILAPHSQLAVSAIDNVSSYGHFPKDSSLINSVTIGGDQHANWFSLLRQELHFFKHRSADGHNVSTCLTKDYIRKISEIDENIPLCITDDLCDGGATFIEGAKVLMEHFPNRKRYLYVIHGLFNKRLGELNKYFDKIYTTNSYVQRVNNEELEVVNVWN